MDERVQRKIERIKKIYTAFLALIVAGVVTILILAALTIIEVRTVIFIVLGLVIVYFIANILADRHLGKLRYS